MMDKDILSLYSQWSEEYYCAGFLTPSPETVKEFCNWLKSRQLESRSVQSVYEKEMLEEFHKQGEYLIISNHKKQLLEDYI